MSNTINHDKGNATREADRLGVLDSIVANVVQRERDLGERVRKLDCLVRCLETYRNAMSQLNCDSP